MEIMAIWEKQNNAVCLSSYCMLCFVNMEQNKLFAMDWMFVSPQNVYVKILTSNVLVLGGGAFWR